MDCGFSLAFGFSSGSSRPWRFCGCEMCQKKKVDPGSTCTSSSLSHRPNFLHFQRLYYIYSARWVSLTSCPILVSLLVHFPIQRCSPFFNVDNSTASQQLAQDEILHCWVRVLGIFQLSSQFLDENHWSVFKRRLKTPSNDYIQALVATLIPVLASIYIPSYTPSSRIPDLTAR